MAGSPIWGAGHHQGFGEGREQGQMEGGAVVAVATAVATALYFAGRWGYGKFRSLQQARFDDAATTQHVDTSTCESDHDVMTTEHEAPHSSEDQSSEA